MTDPIKIAETYSLANKLLKEFGLDDWTFEISNEKNTLGRCNNAKKLITYSSYWLHVGQKEIEDTIRHEIAHALAGPGHGHDEVWRMTAVRVGAKPERCAPPGLKSAAKPNFYIECSGCGKRFPRYRLRKALVNYRSACCGEPFNFYKVVKKK